MKKFRTMRVSRVLQLSVLLRALCWGPCGASISREAHGVPVSHLKMLSLGLGRLFQSVEENGRWTEKQRSQTAAELDGTAQDLENAIDQSSRAGRTHRQVRKGLQILRAKTDMMSKVVRDLHKELEDLETEEVAVKHRMNSILHRMKNMTQLTSGRRAQLNIGTMKARIDKEARRLAILTSEVTARDRMIDRRLQHIEDLEKQVSESLPPALKADCDPDCVQ